MPTLASVMDEGSTFSEKVAPMMAFTGTPVTSAGETETMVGAAVSAAPALPDLPAPQPVTASEPSQAQTARRRRRRSAETSAAMSLPPAAALIGGPLSLEQA